MSTLMCVYMYVCIHIYIYMYIYIYIYICMPYIIHAYIVAKGHGEREPEDRREGSGPPGGQTFLISLSLYIYV